MGLEDEIIKEGEFEYLEAGSGHVIILLHGLFGALSNFREVIAQFSTNYKIVVPIMPIYTMPIIKTNVINLARYIQRFIKYKKYEKVTLLGNSLGGHVALVYALNNMDKVHSMILTGSSGLYENAFGGSFPRREDKEFLRKKIAVTFYDPNFASDELVDEVFGIVNDRSKLIRILAIAKSAIRHNMAKDLSQFEMPSCLIWGANDVVTPPEVADEFNALLPNSELYWIDKCGHAAMMEHPGEFNRILNEWLVKYI